MWISNRYEICFYFTYLIHVARKGIWVRFARFTHFTPDLNYPLQSQTECHSVKSDSLWFAYSCFSLVHCTDSTTGLISPPHPGSMPLAMALQQFLLTGCHLPTLWNWWSWPCDLLCLIASGASRRSGVPPLGQGLGAHTCGFLLLLVHLFV